MNIAYLSTFYPYRGGIAQFNASLYNELSISNNVSAYTFTRQYPKLLFPGKSQLVQADDSALIINSKRILDTINPITYISAYNEISQAKPELLLTKFWMPFFAPSLGYIAKKLKQQGTKSISVLDNVIPHEKRMGDISLIKYFLNRQDGFVVMSNTVKNDLLSLKPDAKFIELEHPLYDHFGSKVDKSVAREKLDLPKDKKILLFFGFIRGYKGLDILIDSLKLLPDEYHLLIAGECYGSFEKYQVQIDRLGLNHRITKFVRYISDKEVPLIFSASDICILPYKSATQSGIIGITYYFDLPVIATDVGSLSEMIKPHKTGMIIEKPNSELLTLAIGKYFADKLEIEFIQNIIEYKKISNWKYFSDKIIEFYNLIK